MQRETRIANVVLGALSALALLLLSLPLSTPVRSVKAGAGYLLDPLAYHGEAGYRRISGLPHRIRQILQADIENEALRAELRRGEWLPTTRSPPPPQNERPPPPPPPHAPPPPPAPLAVPRPHGRGPPRRRFG